MYDKTSHSRPMADMPPKKPGYGLIGSRADSLVCTAPDALGPDRELLESKRQLREEERRRQREQAALRRHITPEEREAALRAMAMDAQYQGVSRRNRVTSNSPDEDGERRHNPTFLHEARRKANGLEGETRLSDRMRQNRNSNQRPDSDNFL